MVIKGVNKRVDAHGDGKVGVVRGSVLLFTVLPGPLGVVLIIRNGVGLAK